MVEVWNGDAVPGETSRGAGFESEGVMFKVGDDHFHNLQGETGYPGSTRESIRMVACEDVHEFIFGTAPDSVKEGPDSWNRLSDG